MNELNLNNLRDKVHANAISKGFWDNWLSKQRSRCYTPAYSAPNSSDSPDDLPFL